MVEQQVTDKPVNQRKPQAARKRRGFWSANPIVVLWGTMVGKKVVMAVTGVILVGFVIAHMLGNIKIFIGEEVFDAYAVFLRDVGRAALAVQCALVDGPRSILLSQRRAAHRGRRRAHAHEPGGAIDWDTRPRSRPRRRLLRSPCAGAVCSWPCSSSTTCCT